MDIGVSTATFFLRKYNEQSIAEIKGLGGETCEVFLECPSEYTEEYGKVLLKNKGDLKVHSMHAVTMNYETELFSSFDRALLDANKSFGGVLSIGKMLGAKFYTMHGRARIKKNGNYDDFEINGKKLEKICDFASNYDIRICLENVPWALYNKPSYFKGVLKYAPNLCATLDLKQARISGYDYKDYLYEMADRIKTVHLSDVSSDGKIRLPGYGVFNFDELFKLLSGEGFDGSMIIEVYKDDFGDDSEITKSLEFLKELRYKYF
ncbi:MAG: sugar phosphate isomerase/epimerase [Clostridiales bacterium]|nr:sugar phosphate isomerase/epimerase [Clostridiales bacterium]